MFFNAIPIALLNDQRSRPATRAKAEDHGINLKRNMKRKHFEFYAGGLGPTSGKRGKFAARKQKALHPFEFSQLKH